MKYLLPLLLISLAHADEAGQPAGKVWHPADAPHSLTEYTDLPNGTVEEVTTKVEVEKPEVGQVADSEK